VTPIWINATTFGYYLDTDASGAEYRLDQHVHGEWRSKDGFYGVFGPVGRKLRFP
jgi:hypothetical protein